MKKVLKRIGLISLCLILLVISAIGVRALLNASSTGKTATRTGTVQRGGTTIYRNGVALTEFDLDGFMEELEESGSGEEEEEPATMYQHVVTLLYQPSNYDYYYYSFEVVSARDSAFTDLSDIPNGFYEGTSAYDNPNNVTDNCLFLIEPRSFYVLSNGSFFQTSVSFLTDDVTAISNNT